MTSPAQEFNPYHAWLGLDRSITNPNYFQLLAIDPQEQNVAKIAAAAQQAITRVRNFRPGSRSAEWARVLDELNAARTCLTDPVRRADYTRRLAAPGGVAARGFSRPAPRNAESTVRVSGSVSASRPRAVPMSAPQPHPTARPAGMPTGTVAGGAKHVPTGIPVGTTGAGVAVAGAVGFGSPGKPASIADSRRPNRSILGPALISVVACLVLLVAVLLLVVAMKEPSTKTRQPASPRVAQSRPAADRSRQEPQRSPIATRSKDVADRFRPAVSESPRKSRHESESGVDSEVLTPNVDEESWTMPPFSELNPDLSTDRNAPTDATPGPEPDSPLTSQPPEQPAGVTPASPPEARLPADAAEMPPTLDGSAPVLDPTVQPVPDIPPSSPPPAFQPKSEDVAALATALKRARSAATDGRFDEAVDELAKLESLPKTPEHQALYDRLNLLAQYAKNFRSALGEALAALASGDEIEVGAGVVVGVVEASAERITVRSQGVNQTRAVSDLPPGLAVAIADTWLREDDPVAMVMKGAYLVARKAPKETELAKARQWFQDASDAGLDIGDLEKVIDDSYDLRVDSSQ